MKWLMFWDFLTRNNYLLNETKIKLLKGIIADSRIDTITKLKASFTIEKKLKKISKTKIINWCVVTGWSHSVLSMFWLSWMQFKEYSQLGLLPGVKKWNH